MDGAALVAFARQLNYTLSEGRASALLRCARATSGHDSSGALAEDSAILPVPDFLRLLRPSGLRAGGGGGGGGGDGAIAGTDSGGSSEDAPTSRARLRANRVAALSEHERQLLSDLRESLFERHAHMKSMFASVDKNHSGAISVEDFLTAMERAGSVVVGGQRGHEIDRGAACISEEEACNIVGFFDKSGDGTLSYDEFMRILQDSKHVLL